MHVSERRSISNNADKDDQGEVQPSSFAKFCQSAGGIPDGELTDNSITTGNSWSDPKPRKFGGLTEAGETVSRLRGRRRTALLQVLCRFLFGQSLLGCLQARQPLLRLPGTDLQPHPTPSRVTGPISDHLSLNARWSSTVTGHGSFSPYLRYSYQLPCQMWRFYEYLSSFPLISTYVTFSKRKYATSVNTDNW